MSKETERKALKRSRASFNLIGKVKVTDKTFNIEKTYDSGWTDNSMYIGVNCGNNNIVYAEMRGGFFSNKDNIIRAYSKDEKDSDGKSKSVEIAWEDRMNDNLLDELSDSSFLTVGIEKDVKGKTVYKKFLSAYDAVNYLDEHLEDETVVNIKGNLTYSEYDGNVSVKKEITSIVLSKVEDEADYKATFTQTILVDSKSIGKKNAEKGTIELSAYVVNYVGSPKIDGNKIEIKKNVSFPKFFEFQINEANPETTVKILQKFFKPKKGKLNEVTVVGNIIESGSVVQIADSDIPDDIKELIEMGAYSSDELEKKAAVSNRSRENRMVILKPEITFVGEDDNKKPAILFEESKYDETDLYFYEQALLDAGYEASSNDDESEEGISDDEDLLEMLSNI